nr:MAG: hypothetical protein [Microvirus sp.]
MFLTAYNRKPGKGEENTGPVLVERAGYISPQKQVENLILAGKRLQAFRMENSEYDFQPGQVVDEDFTDPTRSTGFDLADAAVLAMGASKRLSDARKATEKASKASGDDSSPQPHPKSPGALNDEVTNKE